MEIKNDKNGGNEIFCDKHLGPQVREFLPAIFVAAMIHDEMVFGAKFQDLVMDIRDVVVAADRARPWCCFIGEAKMRKIYEYVYQQTNKNPYVPNSPQRKNPFEKE